MHNAFLLHDYNQSASRNVAFKAARMSEYVLESQDEVITRKSEGEGTGNDHGEQAALDDICRI